MDQAAVRRLFIRALEIPTQERSAFLASAGETDEIRHAVEALLHYDDGAEALLEEAIASERFAAAIGERFGPYELQELLGRGGMGSVFRAGRVDGEMSQTVAIKVVERAWLDPRAIERFRTERQILAGLVHPHIARLLGGGTREDGLPYLVMEYVDGLRLDEYCNRHTLSIPARLRLFQQLCDAVEYAHSNLVVHRDLKPSNVLVTGAGEAKLLDFGVAKALDWVEGARTGTLVLTPDFASPEQAMGGEVTTATDVYGLGAVLFLLLTGESPHKTDGLSAAQVVQAICQQEPRKPSALRPELAGDLENILLKALRIEPARRYRSAREMSLDIENYLHHRPVAATPDSPWYRARRFVRRHWIGLAAASLVVLAIAGGTASTLYQAKRAQQRFAQVRKLSNRFLFDFERSIRDVPGTLPARQMVAGTAREYLQNLTSEARSDDGLTRELAEAHYRLAAVEIVLSQSESALKDLNRAADLLKSVKDDCCGAPAQRRLYIQVQSDLSRLRREARDLDGALALGSQTVAQARGWLQTASAEPEAQRAMVHALVVQGANLEGAGRQSEARAALTEAVDRGSQLVRRNPADEDLTFMQARADYVLASLCATLQDGACARDHAMRSRDLLETLIAQHPISSRYRQLRAMATSSIGSGLRLLSEKDPALAAQSFEQYKRAYELATADARQDPKDRNLADLAVVMTQRFAGAMRRAGKQEQAIALLRDAGAQIDRLLALDPANSRALYLRQNNRGEIAVNYVDLKRWHDALDVLTEQQRYLEQALAGAPNDAVTLENKVSVYSYEATAEWNIGKHEEARGHVRMGLELAAQLIKQDASMEKYIGTLPILRDQARQWHVDDPTLHTR